MTLYHIFLFLLQTWMGHNCFYTLILPTSIPYILVHSLARFGTQSWFKSSSSNNVSYELSDTALMQYTKWREASEERRPTFFF